jgi:aminopeptidase
MTDPRMTRLAEVLLNYSCAVKPGEKVLIDLIDVPTEFGVECVRVARAAGAHPLADIKSVTLNRALMLHGSREQWELIANVERRRMEQVQCYVGVRGSPNVSELSDVPLPQQRLYESTVWQRVHSEVRIPKTRWVVLRWPNAAMAQLAQMSTEAFEQYFFDVCTLDYAKMARAMEPLVARMLRTDQVRLVGPGDTDLTFSIKGIPTKACSGQRNIPDGEIFTAPVRDSVNGVIHYNTPSLLRGVTHENVRFVFRNGQIVEATGSHTPQLNEVLDTDPGARFIGEFSVGVNPYIHTPMKDTLFDEKIAGSIHFTPGRSYEEAGNGNVSEVHWDLVMIQTPAYGGGRMYFDGELVRENGRFVVADLAPLNPENLKG